MSRLVKQIIKTNPQRDGADVIVRRSLGTQQLRNLDPFLMLDCFTVPHTAVGFPHHPHRGIETVTYIFPWADPKAGFRHEDFLGNTDVLRAGDVQWMSAGRGIVHSEIPERGSSGNIEGLQLWITMPKKNKMDPPAYQEFRGSDLVKVEKDGIKATIIAGTALDTKSKTISTVPVDYVHYTLSPGSSLSHPLPSSMNAFMFVIKGEASFNDGKHVVNGDNTVVFDNTGTSIDVKSVGTDDLHLVLVAGEPVNEPIVQYGPMVMNSAQEIQQAFSDYQTATNGFEGAHSYNWKYE